MARKIKIEDLLLDNSPSSVTENQSTAPTGRKHAYPHAPSLPHSGLSGKNPALLVAPGVLTFELPAQKSGAGQLDVAGSRKRKSPVDEDALFPRARIRLPKFSVNIFQADPINVFPIPNEGCVPRMVKYCQCCFLCIVCPHLINRDLIGIQICRYGRHNTVGVWPLRVTLSLTSRWCFRTPSSMPCCLKPPLH